MRVICPVCKRPPEMASISMYLYAHRCEITDTLWFSNGILWSTDQTQVTGVSRGQRNEDKGS